ncbi:MAG: hypothetical protein CMJ59_15300 [Planctomycetaceae bacterium]|nr:hypothetical protein [Planctomycetaceae bacterium]
MGGGEMICWAAIVSPALSRSGDDRQTAYTLQPNIGAGDRSVRATAAIQDEDEQSPDFGTFLLRRSGLRSNNSHRGGFDRRPARRRNGHHAIPDGA